MSRSWLDDKDILIISRPLARAVGINGSIVLRRVQHWLDYNEAHKKKQAATHYHDGRWWAMNGYTGWVNDLEIMSYATVRRTFTHLEHLRLLISTSAYNRSPKDQTKWWSIDYDHYEEFIAFWKQMGSPICREGNQQTAEYRDFMTRWQQCLGVESVVIFCRTLLTVNRVEEAGDPAHDEQGTLLTVNRVEDETLLTVNRHPAHGEHTHPRESRSLRTPEESTDEPAGEKPPQESDVDAVDSRGRRHGYEISEAGVFRAIDENLKQPITPLLKDEVCDALEEFGPEAVLDAVAIAARAGKQWPYAYGVLENWRKEGKFSSLGKMASLADYAASATDLDLRPVAAVFVPPAGLEKEYQAWQAALDQLAVQLDPVTYDTWLRDTPLVAVDTVPSIGSMKRFVIGCRSEFQRDRLKFVLFRTIRRVLKDCYGADVEMVFELVSDQHENAPAIRPPGQGAAVSTPPPQ